VAETTRIRERVKVRKRASHRRWPRRRWPRYVLVALILLAGLAALSLIPALSARDALEAGQGELVRARGLLLSDDAEGAGRAFDQAQADFLRATGDAGNPLLRLEGLIPLAGRTPDAVRTLADIGLRVAAAGKDLSEAISRLPGGLASLAPSGGRIPIDALRSLAPAVGRARAELEAAQARALELPSSFLLGPVAASRNLVQGEVDDAVGAARSAEALLEALPPFAGQGGVRRYFVAAQSPAELRGTGGFIGVYAILTARDGRLLLGPFRDVATLPNLPVSQAPAPTSEFAEIYDRFGGAGFWRNINMTPDAPTAASLIESLYDRVKGVRLDGTIFVDPQALADLLTATGPVQVPVLGRTLRASDVVPFLTNRAYFQFADQGFRKRVLGVAVEGVWQRFLTGTNPEAAIRSLVEAAAGGHLILHSADPKVQAAFVATGIAGQLGASGGDFFGVFASNATGTKVDYYVTRDMRYEISLAAGGTGSAEATVRFTNGAPADATPSYALGPYPGTGLRVGDALSFVSAYCAPGCELAGASRDGRLAGVEAHSERGYPMFATYLRVDAQDSGTLGYSFQLPRAWQGDELGGTYRLRIQGQPTIQPTSATVVVHAPEGMLIVDTSVPMNVKGNEATWRGTIGKERDFVVRFQRPFFGRVWTEIRRFLSKPVVGSESRLPYHS
jgi:Protein of unknown function (DUF4012)